MACLKRFQLTEVEETGKELGRGSYAVVVEVQYHGLRCAAKKIHKIFHQQQVGDLVARFEAECSLLSQLRHPHIVQFLGIYFERGSNTPVLVMEYLPTTLASCLDRYGVLPEEISYSVLRDVVLGLVYLHGHSPPIIHRDLSANNVLLTEGMTAKISDLGVAKMLNLTPAHMTQAPGTQAYMPPEALVATPRYSEKIDIFSYGVMILHILCGRWPVPTREAVDCHTLRGISEAERREGYLDGIRRGHALMSSIHQCLSNNPDIRPEALEIFHQVNIAMEHFPPSYENKVEMLRKIHKDSDNKRQLRDKADGLISESRHRQQEVMAIQTHLEALKLSLNAEVDQLRLEVSTLRAENAGLKTAFATTEDATIAKEEEVRLRLEKKDELLMINLKAKDEILDARLKQKEDEMQARLKEKDEVLKTKLERKDEEVASKLVAKEHEVAMKLLVNDKELTVKRKELDTKDALITTHRSSLEAKDATIQNLLQSLQQMQGFLGKCASPVSACVQAR